MTIIVSEKLHPPSKRVNWLKWLRRLHAWCGLWLAFLGLLFGVSGILLNHRSVMKIEAAQMEKSQIEVALPKPPASAKALAKWLQSYAGINRGPSKISIEPAKIATLSGQTIRQPGHWRIDFHSPQRTISAEYWVGNRSVSIKRQEANFFAFITRLHKGIGMNEDWILLADTLAGGLIFMSLSGLFLLTKLHGPALAMAGLALTSMGLAIICILNAL